MHGTVILAGFALASLAGWIGVLLGTARAWDLSPIGEDTPPPSDPQRWPSVTVLVPARNESAVLPSTLPALLTQEYRGDWRIILVDDRSDDGTMKVARGLATERLELVGGTALPQGWVGKVWALEQARHHAGEPDYYLLTDADIRHARSSLRRLVAESEADGLALNSRMARLSCASRAERLLLPPFLLFFNLLYPMRRVNDPASGVSGAAGGCVLVHRTALERVGGFSAIRDRVIDDVSLARAVKALGLPIRLSVSRSQVASVRRHDLGGVWRMVRRTAFTELRRSWLLVGVTIALLALLFPLPPFLLGVGVGLAIGTGSSSSVIVLVCAAALAWTAMSLVYLPTLRFFGLSPARAPTLALAGCVYGGMTLDSALRGRVSW